MAPPQVSTLMQHDIDAVPLQRLPDRESHVHTGFESHVHLSGACSGAESLVEGPVALHLSLHATNQKSGLESGVSRRITSPLPAVSEAPGPRCSIRLKRGMGIVL